MIRRAPALIAFAILGAVTACSSAPQDFTVNGTVEVAVQSYDEFQQDYPQITNDTAQVTITDPSGKVIAVTTADNGNVHQGPSAPGDLTLTTGFTVKVPEGLSFYGISVSGVSGTIHFTEAQMKAGPALCVGDACSSG
jgi:hypothetical protein